jgi:hypothetical protein
MAALILRTLLQGDQPNFHEIMEMGGQRRRQ